MADWPNSSIAPGGIAISAGSLENSIYAGIVAFMGTGVWSITTAWVANVAVFVPFVISEETVFQRATWENGATVAGSVSVGIYDSQQNCLKDSTGANAEAHTAMTGASAQQTLAFANNVTAPPGQYYLGFSSDNTGTLGVISAAATAGIFRGMGVFQQTSAYPLPTPKGTFAVMAQTFCPSVALIARSV